MSTSAVVSTSSYRYVVECGGWVVACADKQVSVSKVHRLEPVVATLEDLLAAVTQLDVLANGGKIDD